MIRARHIIITLLSLMAGTWVRAQGDPLVEALRKFQAGDLVRAKELIDQAVKDPAHAQDPEAWLLRGFVYKDGFKDAKPGPEADLVRNEALASLYTCMGLDSEGTYRENAMQAYDFLARTYYNDAAKAMQELDDKRALQLYDNYKEAMLRVDPKANMRARDIEFHNALGTVYTKRFDRDRTVVDWFNKAVDTFRKVLTIDPENYGANYNLATLYYNRGVYNIQRISADDDIPGIQRIQEVSREYFMDALPYMLKAHDMNPGRRETLLGLEIIYYSLQDQERSDLYRRLFEELPPVEQDR